MKRSVAILGPTPAFVRWSLEHPCELRQLDCDNLPDATFRQLRGAREYSVASRQGRVFEDVCVHPDSDSHNHQQATGFYKDEVLAVFGGEQAVAAACESCSANTDADATGSSGLWAGCYGWLAVDGSSLSTHQDFPRHPPEHPADFLVREIGNVVGMLNIQPLVENNFPSAKSAWYSFWQQRIPQAPQLLLLEKIFSAVLRRHETQASEPFVDDLLRFIDALTISHRQQIPIHVELVPNGHSDGNDWTVSSHCRTCKYSGAKLDSKWKQCPACGAEGQHERSRKFKVLGLRPYVNLVRVMGDEPAKSFLQRYEAQAKANGR